MSPRREGESFGCTDTAPPDVYTEYELSRLVDVLDSVKRLGGTLADHVRQQVLNALPSSMKLEATWANWTYKEYDER